VLKRTDADKEEVKKEEAKAVISENGADAAAERTGVKERVKEVIPIDEYLGIDKLPYKMTSMMMNQTAFWGQNQSSFKKAEEVMNNMLNIKMTDELIRDVTYYVGKKVFDSDTVNAEKIDKTMANMAYTRDKEGVLFRFRGECPGNITASSRHKGAALIPFSGRMPRKYNHFLSEHNTPLLAGYYIPDAGRINGKHADKGRFGVYMAGEQTGDGI
jgi:hypothetical protein